MLALFQNLQAASLSTVYIHKEALLSTMLAILLASARLCFSLTNKLIVSSCLSFLFIFGVYRNSNYNRERFDVSGHISTTVYQCYSIENVLKKCNLLGVHSNSLALACC